MSIVPPRTLTFCDQYQLFHYARREDVFAEGDGRVAEGVVHLVIGLSYFGGAVIACVFALVRENTGDGAVLADGHGDVAVFEPVVA